MIKEAGRVIAIENAAVWVETVRQSTCQSCSVQKGCGHGLLARIGSGRRHHVRVLPGTFSLQAIAVDDQVEIAIPERVLVSGAFMVYLLPLLMMLAGAGLASHGFSATMIHQDLVALLGAAFGFGAGLLAVKYYSFVHRNDSGFQPYICALLTRTESLAVNIQGAAEKAL